MSDIVIPQKRGAHWWLFGICVLLFAGGMIGLSTSVISGAMAMAFGAIGAWIFFRWAMDPTPRLVLSDQGIEDRLNGFGLIEWRDIRHAYRDSVEQSEFIGLEVNDYEKYASRASGARKLMARMQRTSGITALTIAMAGLNISSEDLLMLINEHRARAGKLVS